MKVPVDISTAPVHGYEVPALSAPLRPAKRVGRHTGAPHDAGAASHKRVELGARA